MNMEEGLEVEKKFEKLTQCPDCKAEDIGYSFDQDEHFCRKCGLVLD